MLVIAGFAAILGAVLATMVTLVHRPVRHEQARAGLFGPTTMAVAPLGRVEPLAGKPLVVPAPVPQPEAAPPPPAPEVPHFPKREGTPGKPHPLMAFA